jgi:hypothetical protein
MTDLKGQPYSKLTTAFLYRTEYKEACKCKPDPWSTEALARHRLYALEERRRKGDKSVAAEIARLKSAGSAAGGSGGGKPASAATATSADTKRR